ncbi:protein SERAC1 [Marchantia polymorpha subsp. ruderalis]|uniref:Glycoside hydrolase family 19 catalytic domain-containing protein n=1 Tax=Marchantia polymorpha subsp. ruderalis TaxID=1480154 RepID=A0AAF6BE02_MARPO|nr:hypothetical protein Mp_5g02050 [Marchantia polymorpha subsp. ruderalis]
MVQNSGYMNVITGVRSSDGSLKTDGLNEVPEEKVSDALATETASMFANRINDELFVLYEPSYGPYDMEIIFVHDLYTEGSEDAWKTTWTNDDGTCWPREFLGKKFPRARILSVSYDACVITNSTQGRMNSLFTIAENLMVNFFLPRSKVGLTSNCPVLFVGHGLGCFVIKNLMLKASEQFAENEEKRRKFLENVGGFVFYSPFNSGVKWDLYANESGQSNTLTDCLRPHSAELSRLNEAFASLRRRMKERRKSRFLWTVLTICESHQTSSRKPGSLQRSGTFVTEGTARFDCELFRYGVGDHFNVCKHQSTANVNYQCMEDWLDSILTNSRKPSRNSMPNFDPTAENFKAILPRKLFLKLFPKKNPFYEYAAFIEAAVTFVPQGFGVDVSEDDQKREIAALLAHFDHESCGLRHKEQCCPPSTHCPEGPCHPCKSYHGRGPLQLCGNHNYKLCGEGIGDDSLLSFPEKLSQDPVIAFKSALWFWCTPQWNKPSCHSVMTGKWTPTSTDVEASRLPGFGLTINIINRIDCVERDSAHARVEKYKFFCERLAVHPGENIDCRYQKPFL